MPLKREWLQRYSWNFVTGQNAVLCMQKQALHKPTSDGHNATQALWESKHNTAMTLAEAADLCRLCHRMAPFCFYNGNTFAAIVRDVVEVLATEQALDASQAFILRSLAGHIVAGVATGEEANAFQRFSDSLV